MTRFDFYESIYYKELDRKNAINDSLTLPIGVITGLIAWLFYFFDNYYVKDSSGLPNTFFIIYIISLVTLLLSIISLILSYFQPKFIKKKYFITSAYDYYYLSFSKEYEKYYQECKETKQNNENAELEELLIEHFIQCSDHNIILNNKKNARLLRAKLFLISTLFLSFILLVYPTTNASILHKQSEPQEIKIIDSVKIHL